MGKQEPIARIETARLKVDYTGNRCPDERGWSVENQVYRMETSGPGPVTYFQVVRGYCNGLSTGSDIKYEEKDALALMEGRKL